MFKRIYAGIVAIVFLFTVRKLRQVFILSVVRNVFMKVFILYRFYTKRLICHKCSVCPYTRIAQEYCCLMYYILTQIRVLLKSIAVYALVLRFIS